MLMESLEKWRKSREPMLFRSDIDEDSFSIFFQEHSAGKTFMQMLNDLAMDVYELQVCVDGLLEDLEK